MPKVSFDLPETPWEVQRKELEAERKRLDMIQQAQLAQPLRGDMVSGYYVAPSWTQGLARAVGAYLGRKDREHLSKRGKDLREEEQKSLVDDVNAYFEKAFGKPGTPETTREVVGRMVDPPEYWKPTLAQTFGLDQAPQGTPLQLDLQQNPDIPDREAVGAALATEYGQPKLPVGTDFTKYTEPPFVPPTLPPVQQRIPEAPAMPPFASAPPIVQQTVPGQPGIPADPRAALALALSSRHKIMQQIGLQNLMQQAGGEGDVGMKEWLKAAAYIDPASLTAIGAPDTFKQLVMRNNVMALPEGAAPMEKTTGGVLPTAQGRFSQPFQRGGDWYQVDQATGRERKLDNAANVQIGVQTFEPALGKVQADIIGTQLGDARKMAESARKDMLVLDQAEKFLQQGIKTGILVEPRNYLDKLAVATGFMSDNPNISNTDLMIRTMRQRASAILASGAYGAGTGISEKDLEEVVKVATGKDMTKEGLQAFIRVAKHTNKLAFREYSRRLQLMEQMPGVVPGFTQFMGVDETSMPMAPAVGEKPAADTRSREEKLREIEQLERELGLRK